MTSEELPRYSVKKSELIQGLTRAEAQEKGIANCICPELGNVLGKYLQRFIQYHRIQSI